jgi:toxin ParE1/3/4
MPARKKFAVLFPHEALIQLQKNIDYYNLQQQGLGKRFAMAIKTAAKVLETNPFFQVRYDNIRCIPINKFPFMMHFSINEDTKNVRIIAILHTAINPDKHWDNE